MRKCCIHSEDAPFVIFWGQKNRVGVLVLPFIIYVTLAESLEVSEL